MSHPVADLGAFLSGRWRIARRIDDKRLGILGRLTGCVTFTPSPGGLIQDEDGDLSFGTYRGPATRRYHLVIDRPSMADVHHADGRLFHTLDLASGGAEILHHCGADVYRGRYRVIDGDRFFLSWRVRGPHKDYASVTRYTR